MLIIELLEIPNMLIAKYSFKIISPYIYGLERLNKLGVYLSLQDHFEQSQFEEIARSSAGGKKLKPNAIPTLFSFGEPPYPAVTSPYILLPMKSEPGMGTKVHLL